MRLRKKWWARPEMQQDSKVIFKPENFKDKWKYEFKNNNPIHLELGSGKGQFISSLSTENKQVNYIGIDLKDEVLVYALRKVNQVESDNVRLIPTFIEGVDNIFGTDEISRVYINFCNPWPKAAHNKRRLTHPRFIKKYKGFIKKGSEVWFKTDDLDLFNDSLEYFENEGFNELYKTYNLTQSNFEENIQTEYEEKFISFGKKINFAIFEYEGLNKND
ncbi:MAG: tRNA (guanosine(46)-N7)-methyltransferase TrmB [Clostridium sp.]|nr:tRNA (guanosine(46)-N7)-methyltransferase TrmB [Clostridium sp.]